MVGSGSLRICPPATPVPHVHTEDVLMRLRRQSIEILGLGLVLALLLASNALATPLPANAVSNTLVVSQVYGGGGNTGAPLTHDFVELFNRGTTTVDLTGWSVQYASATGSSWQVTMLSGTVAPGHYYLVQEAAGASCGGGPCGSAPPPSDVSGSIPMSASSGKVALVQGMTALTVACPSDPQIVDFVGYGTASCAEANTPAPTLNNTTAALRANSGCIDTDSNGADFTTGAPAPRNTASAPTSCSASSVTPTATATGEAPTATATGATPTATGSPSATPTPTGTVLAVRIHDIQGASHLSPLQDQSVANVQGIVTALRSNGFYMQDPLPDADERTSEGIFVFTSTSPSVTIGNAVKVSGTVVEFRPGGSSGTTNLTTTELAGPGLSVQIVPLLPPTPTPIVIGIGGRLPPTQVIEDDSTTGNVETGDVFDPEQDGLDFYESLEGMLVQVNDAVAVGPRSDFGSNREIPIVGDNGTHAGLRTPRGGLVIRPEDFNPERLILNDLVAGGPTLPLADVGDTFPGPTVGVIDYSFGNFKLEVLSLPAKVDGGVARETTTPTGSSELAVATFNVENLDPTDPPAKFASLADLIVNNLKAPDLVAVEEIQDNSGPTNDGVVDAAQTYALLIGSIRAAGGPAYDYRQINPVNNQDGGEPGGNIRQGFLFRTDRGLSFVDRPGGTSTSAATVVCNATPQLSASPGRLDPTNAAFTTSRKPLVGEFQFRGTSLFAVANHFNSKGGDQPLFGRYQPPTLSSEVQRHQQAQIVHDFVSSLLACDANTNVLVLGDLNDFQFSETLAILKGSPPVLSDLIDTLPADEQYTYVYQGNSQVLDHMLISPHLQLSVRGFDVVHVNAEFADQTSDHDPSVARLDLLRTEYRLYLPFLVKNQAGP